jgi:hypothetical protein
VPALDARLSRLLSSHTLPCGISVDSKHSHAAWAEQLGGVSFPLLSDFHPKGAVARSMGVYLEQAGITDRATVIVDAGGTVRYAQSVTPAGKRDIEALVAFCEQLDAEWDGDLPAFDAAPGLTGDESMYVKDHCMFSRWVRYARMNLHLDGDLPVRNVTQDAQAMSELVELGGKSQAPALRSGDTFMYESGDIVAHLVGKCGLRW